VKSLTGAVYEQFERNYRVPLNDLGIELVLLEAAEQSETFNRMESLANDDINMGQDQQNLWDERFARITHYSKKIVIIDQHCGSQLCRLGAESGTARFLKRLNTGSKHLELTIYTSISETLSQSEVTSAFQDLLNTLSPGGIESIDLRLGNSSEFRKKVHPRSIRFDKVVVNLDAGVELFKGDTVTRDTTMSCRRDTENSKSREKTVGEICVHRHELYHDG